jgi:hypothetical protein
VDVGAGDAAAVVQVEVAATSPAVWTFTRSTAGLTADTYTLFARA